mgnify:CR=1 FL=1
MTEHLISTFEAVGLHGLRWFWLPLFTWSVLVAAVHLITGPAKQLDRRLPFWLHRALWWALPAGVLLSATGLISTWLVRSGGRAAELSSAGAEIWIGTPLARQAASGAADGASVVLLLAGAATVAALGSGAYHLLGLLVGSMRLRALRGDGTVPEGLSRRTRSIARRIGVSRPVTTMVSPSVSVPMTFGWRRPVIVLPERLLNADSDANGNLDLAIAHELVHIRRGDFRESWFEELVAALFAGYPLVRWVRRRLSFFREVACDSELLERLDVARAEYARLLLRIAGGGVKPGGTALALSESSHTLKDRIQAMTENTPYLPDSLEPRRLGTALGGLLLVGGALFVACSEVVGPDPSPSSAELAEREESALSSEGSPSDAPASAGSEVFVAVEEMPELKGGIAGLQQEITYPEEAAENGVEGQVIVQFEVTEEGDVEDPRVLRGVSESLDEEALRAVREAQFEPGRQQGEPVRVKMSLPITFRLGGSEQDADGGASPNSGSGESTSSAASPSWGDLPPIAVLVNARGEVLLGEEPIALEELRAQLRERIYFDQGSPPAVRVLISEGASPETVRRVQEAVRGSGALQASYSTRG